MVVKFRCFVDIRIVIDGDRNSENLFFRIVNSLWTKFSARRTLPCPCLHSLHRQRELNVTQTFSQALRTNS
jgi:hypothetical protein